MEESIKKKRYFTAIAELNVAQKNILHGDLSYFAYFIPIYVSFLIVKTCRFVMGFVILAIYFRLKKCFVTIFNVKT